MKKINYYARWSRYESTGVLKKMNGIIKGLQKNNFDANLILIDDIGISGHLKLFINLFKAECDIIIIRTTAFSMFLMWIPLLMKKARRIRVVYDIPSPIRTVFLEVINSHENILKKALKIFLLFLSYPISLFAATKVIEYANDFNYHKMFCKNITIETNGIDIDEYEKIEKVRDDNCLNLIAVAYVQFWHGYDRIIKSLKTINLLNDDREVKFSLIGDGPELSNLKMLAKDLGVDKYVEFLGRKDPAQIREYMERADIGISSIGLFRKNLNICSDLKSREYAAYGLPIVTLEGDNDFAGQEFVYFLKNNAEQIDLSKLINWYYNGNDSRYSEIRKFAEQNLDYSKKVMAMYCE